METIRNNKIVGIVDLTKIRVVLGQHDRIDRNRTYGHSLRSLHYPEQSIKRDMGVTNSKDRGLGVFHVVPDQSGLTA